MNEVTLTIDGHEVTVPAGSNVSTRTHSFAVIDIGYVSTTSWRILDAGNRIEDWNRNRSVAGPPQFGRKRSEYMPRV